MYAVLEEIENNYATLILDSKAPPIVVPVSQLPHPYKRGDVFFVERQNLQWVVVSNDVDEKERRLKANRMKREKLLNRSRSEKDET